MKAFLEKLWHFPLYWAFLLIATARLDLGWYVQPVILLFTCWSIHSRNYLSPEEREAIMAAHLRSKGESAGLAPSPGSL